MKNKLFVFLLVFFFGFVFSPSFVLAENGKANLYFFYSPNCLHCAKEKIFLEKMEEKYPDLAIHRYSIQDQESLGILQKMAQECGAEQYLGLVPITFVEKEFFLGFDNEKGVGRDIETAIIKYIEGLSPNDVCEDQIKIPFLGKIDKGNYSLPVLAVVLGFFDGFNVCSLGALVLILSLVLVIKSRTKVLLFGGIFLLATAIIYGALISLWHQIFFRIARYTIFMDAILGAFTIFGAYYFFRQFLKYKKQGPLCEAGQKGLAAKLSARLQNIFSGKTNILLLAGSVLIFAVLITIVEFPCSAVLPLVFAGSLAQAQVSVIGYFFYLFIYLLFYLLDEIIIFLVAVFTMKLWLTSGKFLTWLNLAASILLLLLGAYYLYGIFGK